ncbi:MAG: glycosyltransferase family 4 protein [Planctomycetes bacterium]|nr:glycosyltransferase family 4 protein [Planctomycetota bacterium]
MRIAVDASILEPPCPTGVERVAAGIVRAMRDVISDGEDVVVFSRAPLLGFRDAVRFRNVALGGPDAPLVWRETDLAPALAMMKVAVLWSPVTAIPMRTSVPRVATFHEAPWLVRPGMEGMLRERAHALRLRVAVAAAARIVVPSEATAAQLRQLHPDAAPWVRVVAHGVDERFFAPQDEAAAARRRADLGLPARYLLQVGGNRPRKNVPGLLRAFARYRLRGGRSDLVLAGPGPDAERTPRGVTSLGWVDDDTLVALYGGASALVLASDSEGYGIPVLEAFALGVPVVACAAGGVVEAAGGAAMLVPVGDDEALAAAMLEVETDDTARANLIWRGRARAATCRWDASARKLVAVLREAVVGKNVGATWVR